MREKWLSANIHIDTTGQNGSVITCKKCKSKTDIKTAGNFSPYSVFVQSGTAKARTKQIKTQKQALEYFMECHWESCEKTHGAYFEEICQAPHLQKI